MANTRSAKKRVRSSLRKRTHNRAMRSSVKTLVQRGRKLTGEQALPTNDEVRRAISALDKAAEKGVLHANNASRRKSRLMRLLAKTAPKPEAKATPKKEAPKGRGRAKDKG
jgi:small subunit ribosomal protein S20